MFASALGDGADSSEPRSWTTQASSLDEASVAFSPCSNSLEYVASVTTSKRNDKGAESGLRKPGRKRFGLLAELVVLLLLFLAVRAYQTRDLLKTDGEPAPELRLPALTGDELDLARMGGRPTLVYFFAPWCGVCSASADNVRRLRSMRDEQALSILVVALDWQSVEEVSAYAERHRLNVPVLLGDEKTQRDWKVTGFPTYYVVDAEGRIVRKDYGYSSQLGLWWRSWAHEIL